MRVISLPLVGLVVLVLPVATVGVAAAAATEGCADGLEVGDVRMSVGGQYRLMLNAANVTFHAPTVSDDQDHTSLANQRLRTWVNLHDRKRCRYGVYLQAEVGHLFLGDGLEFPKTFRSGADQVGVELRRGFLWYKPTDRSLLRAGVVGWEDRFGGRPTFSDPLWGIDRYDSSQSPLANSVWDFNVGGVVFEASPGEHWRYSLAALVLQRGDQSVAGDGGTALYTLDVDRRLGTALWGASAYYLNDQGGYSYGTFGGPRLASPDDSWDLWVGGRGHFRAARADHAVFVIVNRGEADAGRWEHTGWAAKWASDVSFRAGTFKAQLLYATGDDGSQPGQSGEFRTIAQSVRDNRGAQSYWSLLGVSSPRGPSDVNDLGIGLQNGGYGLVTLQGGWEQPLAADISLYAAAGWLRSDTPRPATGSTNLGAELLAEIHWQMAELLALDAGGGWLFTGDFFRERRGGPGPSDLFELYARWQLEF